jgi:hypothetical protein
MTTTAKSVREFEMKVVNFADWVKHSPFRVVRFIPWFLLLLILSSGLRLMREVTNLEAWTSFLFASCYSVYCWFPGWFPQPKSRRIVLDETAIRFPVKVFGTKEIPRAQISEVSPMSSGVMIAWKKNGAPWYTELSERSFDPVVWSEFRQALMEWGNRESGGCVDF